MWLSPRVCQEHLTFQVNRKGDNTPCDSFDVTEWDDRVYLCIIIKARKNIIVFIISSGTIDCTWVLFYVKE